MRLYYRLTAVGLEQSRLCRGDLYVVDNLLGNPLSKLLNILLANVLNFTGCHYTECIYV